MTKKYLKVLRNSVGIFLGIGFLNGLIHFPYDTDAPLTRGEIEAAQQYYAKAYAQRSDNVKTPSEYDAEYIRVAKAAASESQIENRIAQFVEQYKLQNRPVLDIGSGRGNLQDLAEDYTGLDISPTVARFYHKNFVLGSATAMPFQDDSFEGAWSIFVFEHIPNPEQAFLETRRVLRNQGVVYLLPAWNCSSWAAQGYEVRPYGDLDFTGKLIKASIPVRKSLPFMAFSMLPGRIIRQVVSWFGPTRLHYKRLTPNYEKYWTGDSDAVNSIDIHEALVWFRSRGDECLNCNSQAIFTPFQPLIIRVHK